MAKMKSVFFGLVMMVFTMSAYSQNAGDFNVVLTNDGKGVIVTGYTGSVLDVKIPSEIEGLPVREIRELRVSKIRSLVIPDTVTTIGDRAFCLVRRGVTYIGGTTSTDLVSVMIPDSVINIGKMAFGANTKLASVVLPDNIKTIPDDCFYLCESLASIILPSNLISLGATAFEGCSSLKSINLPSSVVSVGEGAFQNCSSLASVNFPAAFTGIGKNAFKNTGIVSVTIPPNVTQIPEGAFSGCEKLTGVIFGEKIQVISADAFSGCSQLASITIPDGITTLYGSNSFPAPTAKLNLATQARLRNITWISSLYYLYDRAKREMDGNNVNVQQALSYFDQQLQLTPDHIDTYIQRGALYQNNGDLDKARADMEKVLQLDPKSVVAYVRRGALYLRSGDLDKARADIEKALQLKPKDSEALRIMREVNSGAQRQASRQASQESQERERQAMFTQIRTSLEPLQKDLSTLQPLKKLNARQYTTFEEICRKCESVYFKYDEAAYRKYDGALTLFDNTYRDIAEIFRNKLNAKQQKNFSSVFPRLVPIVQ
jgi:tetratricopeptide (TPR) repeat protein